MLILPRRMLEESFHIFRACGANRRECQVYWLSSWDNPLKLVEVVHPDHSSSAYGLANKTDWLQSFWTDLANRGLGVRVQVHTHPFEAFHSKTDDAYPLLFDVGFLSLVVPNFGTGPIGFQDAYLAEIQPNGRWSEIEIKSRLMIDG